MTQCEPNSKALNKKNSQPPVKEKYTKPTHIFINPLKSTALIVRLKADKLSKLTQSGKLVHTSTTLYEKKFALTLLHLGLYNLYACRLLVLTGANSKKNHLG